MQIESNPPFYVWNTQITQKKLWYEITILREITAEGKPKAHGTQWYNIYKIEIVLVYFLWLFSKWKIKYAIN